MNFSDNLYYLRKRDKITQEELADKLGVSRQSVSKWETGEAYPETDKLIAICDMFGVSLDSLVRGDVTNADSASEAEHESKCACAEVNEGVDATQCGFYAVIDKFSRGIALGVFLVLFGVALCITLAGISTYLSGTSKEFMSIMSGVAVLLFVAVAVFIFVFSGINYDRFRKKYPMVKNVCTEQEAQAFARKFSVAMACLVSAILLDVIFLVVLSAVIDSGIIRMTNPDGACCVVVAAFMLLLSLIVCGIVYFGIQHTKYNVGEYNSQTSGHEIKFKDPICAAIMLSATALFLVLGFVWNLWHPGWIVFPVGGIICGIVNALAGIKGKGGKDK